MADERKIFPIEKILELVMDKAGANINEAAGYILGRTIDNPESAKAAAPFASTWLARWYPRFLDLEWKEGDSWESFLKQAQATIGDHISITPMTGRLKKLAGNVLDAIKDANESLVKQTDAVVALEKRVRELEPLEARLAAEQKKYDDLENKLKTMKGDMGALQRQAAEYQGKIAIDHDELLQNIKDAIKDGLKGISIGAAVAGTAAAASDADASAPAKDEVPDGFGFGSSGADADGFGF